MRFTFCLLGILLSLIGLTAVAQAKHKVHTSTQHHKLPTAPVKTIEKVETVEAIDPTSHATAAPQATSDQKATQTTQLIGHLHPAVVHLPIAWFCLLLIVDMFSILGKRAEWLLPGLYLSIMTTLSFLPAIVTGLWRLTELPNTPEAIGPALLHRNLMYIGFAFCNVITLLRLFKRNQLSGFNRRLYLFILGLGWLVVCYSAHLGGKLVYGDDFLPF